jgi:hypothetical protein
LRRANAPTRLVLSVFQWLRDALIVDTLQKRNRRKDWSTCLPRREIWISVQLACTVLNELQDFPGGLIKLQITALYVTTNRHFPARSLIHFSGPDLFPSLSTNTFCLPELENELEKCKRNRHYRYKVTAQLS